MLFSSFIDTLSASIDARDKITSGHSKRVTLYAELICDKCRLSEYEKEIIKNASLLHDIGKIGIKDSVLQKEGKGAGNQIGNNNTNKKPSLKGVCYSLAAFGFGETLMA